MTRFEMRRRYLTVTYLLACALNDVTPSRDLIPEEHIDGLYQYAKHHSVGALVSVALEKIGLIPKNAIAERNMAIRKIMLLDAGRAEIFARFEAEGIKYMPLKGVIIKEMYPSIGLRQMADNDILFDPAYRERVKEIMQMNSAGQRLEAFFKLNPNKVIEPTKLQTIANVRDWERTLRMVRQKCGMDIQWIRPCEEYPMGGYIFHS